MSCSPSLGHETKCLYNLDHEAGGKGQKRRLPGSCLLSVAAGSVLFSHVTLYETHQLWEIVAWAGDPSGQPYDSGLLWSGSLGRMAPGFEWLHRFLSA
ncbi:hypothetical protein ACRRTK_023597 [Alexandromys fortis]